MKMIQTIKGDILNATEEYICQQCNCISVRPHGLSDHIARKYPYANPYSSRRPIGRRNMAILDDRATPGTIQVFGFDPNRKIVCMFAQYGMGKPFSYNNIGNYTISDSPMDRVTWFSQCLERISELQPTSVAFPYKIGCGLAGGSWTIYSDMLSAWSNKHPKITINIISVTDIETKFYPIP